MSWHSRLANAFRARRVNEELDAERQSHIEEAVEKGRSRQEATRAFGSAL